VTLERIITLLYGTQKKEFGKHFVNYLGPTMFNIIKCKKTGIQNNVNNTLGYEAIYIIKIVFAYKLEQL